MFVDADRGIKRLPYLLLFEDQPGPCKDVCGGIEHVVLRSHLLKPSNSPSKAVIIFMHPIGGGEYLPLRWPWRAPATTSFTARVATLTTIPH